MSGKHSDGTSRTRCKSCDRQIAPGQGLESAWARDPEGTKLCRDCVDFPRIAFVGCGAKKLDTDDPVPARDLYTSNYFRLKREYAEETCDSWYIVSAEHRLLSPDTEVSPYDTTISDLSDYNLGKWSVRTSTEISTALSFKNPYTEVVLLMGSSYLDHIEERAWSRVRKVIRPFEGTSGIGEQMGVLREKIDTYHPPGQSDLQHYARTDGGVE